MPFRDPGRIVTQALSQHDEINDFSRAGTAGNRNTDLSHLSHEPSLLPPSRILRDFSILERAQERAEFDRSAQLSRRLATITPPVSSSSTWRPSNTCRHRGWRGWRRTDTPAHCKLAS